jgi:anaerobic selenocysteine-containing dehydrogenase
MRQIRHYPIADINPVDAHARSLKQDDWILLSTPRSAIRVKAIVTVKTPPGIVNMFHGYPEADVNTLIEPDYLDPVTGYPGFKSLLCQITAVPDS